MPCLLYHRPFYYSKLKNRMAVRYILRDIHEPLLMAATIGGGFVYREKGLDTMELSRKKSLNDKRRDAKAKAIAKAEAMIKDIDKLEAEYRKMHGKIIN